MRILLLNPPFRVPILRDNYCCHTSKADYLWPPADLLYLSGHLNRPEFCTKVIDAVVEKINWQQVHKKILQFRPDFVVTLSGGTSLSQDLEGIKSIKDHMSCKIILMGNVPAFEPVRIFEKYKFIDAIFQNFFDARLVEYFRSGHISPSISTKDRLGRINIFDSSSTISQPPPQHDLFPLEKYSTPISLKTPLVTMVTSFGCPYSCSFCVAGNLHIAYRDLRELEDEFENARASGIKEIFFMDSTMNANPDRLYKICEMLISKNYNFSWSCNIHCNTVSPKLFKIMKQAGCHTIQIGVESGTAQALKIFAPSKNIEKLRAAFDLAQQIGLRTLAYLIVGFPNENLEDVRKSIDFLISLEPNFASFSTLVPEIGTELHRDLQTDVLAEDIRPLNNSGAPFGFKSDKLSIAEKVRLRRYAYKKFYLRPKQLYKMMRDFRNFPVYARNARALVGNYLR